MPIANKQILLEKRSVQRDWPMNITEPDKSIFQNDISMEFPQVNLVEYKNVGLTPQGILFNNLSVYDQSYVWPYQKEEYNWKYLVKNFIKRRSRTLSDQQKYIICFDNWSNGYYHWISDLLPRLYLIRNYLKTHTLLLPDYLNAEYMKETLKVFGVTNIHYYSKNEYLKVPTLLVPERVTLSKDHDKQIMGQIRSLFFSYYNIPNVSITEAKRKVYVSRTKAHFRKALNEEEYLGTLKKLGYEICCFEDMSFREQLIFMSTANTIIAVHGGNLVNGLFMPEGSRMVELRPKPSLNNCYFSLAAANKMEYYYVMCEEIERPHFSDVVVPVSEFVKLLETYKF